MRITPLGAPRPFLRGVRPRQNAAVSSLLHWHRAGLALWSASWLLTFKELAKQNPGMNKYLDIFMLRFQYCYL